MQLYEIDNTVAAVLLQGCTIWYKQSFSFLPNVYFYGCCVCLFLIPSVWKKFGWKHNLKIMGAGIVDAAANCLFTFAYQYTSLASVTILSCLNIPTAMIMSYFMQKVKYNWIQIFSAIFAIGSAVTFTLVDQMTASNDFTPEQQLIGDMASIAASCCIGVGSVLNEILSADMTPFQYVSRLGGSAFLIVLIPFFSLELNATINARWEVHLLILAYGVLVMMLYFITVIVLKNSSAAFYLISYLPVNIYSFLSSILVFAAAFQWYIIFPSFGIIGAVLIYLYGEQRQRRVQKVENISQMETDISKIEERQSLVENVSEV